MAKKSSKSLGGKKKVSKSSTKPAAREDTRNVIGGDEPWLTPTTTREELHAWIKTHLGVTLANAPIMEANNCAMDYIEHAFFAGVHEAPLAEVQGANEGPLDCVVWAHRGGGKTFLGAIATVLDLVFRPGIEVRILGGSMEQSKRMHAHLRGFFGAREEEEDASDDAGEGASVIARGRLNALVSRMGERVIALKNGSRVELLAQSERSVRGTRVQRLRCDEADMFKAEVWEAAQLVTRSKQCGRFAVRASVECLSTMHNPSGVMDKVVQECHRGVRRLIKWGVVDSLEACGDEHVCKGQSSSACPLLAECAGKAKEPYVLGHVRVDDAIVMKRRVAQRTWKSEMLCERPVREGVVLEEFDPAVHVVRDEAWEQACQLATERAGTSLGVDGVQLGQRQLRWVYGMDFGFRAPTVALVGVVIGPTGAAGSMQHERSGAASTLWIVDEWVREKMVLGEHIQAIVSGLSKWPACEWIGVDPAGHTTNDQTGKSAIAAMREAGLVVRATRTTVEEGLNHLRARLLPADAQSGPRLFIHARCEKLIESVQNYRYGEGDQRHVPQKDGHDHAVDALRYLVSNLDRNVGTHVRGY